MKWIHIKGNTYKCPACGTRFIIREKWNCCPICEQKLNGVKEQSTDKRQEKKAFKTVLDTLSHVPLFRGVYDAKHGDAEFMCGIQTVMETIAWYADDRNYGVMFTRNMLGSEQEYEEDSSFGH